MSKPKARNSSSGMPKGDLDRAMRGESNSILRCLLALILVCAGIAWIVVYMRDAMDAATWVEIPGSKRPATNFPWMADLKDWNWLIGFGMFFLGLLVSAHKGTPLGRGRGVVVGMLGSFLLGLVWICVYYFVTTGTHHLPLISDMGQKNLFVGVAFMAVGFAFATKWE